MHPTSSGFIVRKRVQEHEARRGWVREHEARRGWATRTPAPEVGDNPSGLEGRTSSVAIDRGDEALPPCALCDAPTRREPNPFYGTALSVHRHVLVCTACATVGFEATPDRPESEEARCRPRRASLRTRMADWYRSLP